MPVAGLKPDCPGARLRPIPTTGGRVACRRGPAIQGILSGCSELRVSSLMIQLLGYRGWHQVFKAVQAFRQSFSSDSEWGDWRSF